ncbi:LOW QUALITY PROTEIN: hypothetical protein OPAG_05007, partial [Rhodococcus opacus PD630]
MHIGARPMPVPTPISAPFWEGCTENTLRYQRCEECDTAVFRAGGVLPVVLVDAAGMDRKPRCRNDIQLLRRLASAVPRIRHALCGGHHRVRGGVSQNEQHRQLRRDRRALRHARDRHIPQNARGNDAPLSRAESL